MYFKVSFHYAIRGMLLENIHIYFAEGTH